MISSPLSCITPSPFSRSRTTSSPSSSSPCGSINHSSVSTTPPDPQPATAPLLSYRRISFPSPSSVSTFLFPSQQSQSRDAIAGRLGGASEDKGVTKGEKVGLSAKRIRLAVRMLEEALEEEERGEKGEEHAEFIVHLLAIALSSILSSLPPAYLISHPSARQALVESLPSSWIVRSEGSSPSFEGGPAGDWRGQVVESVIVVADWMRYSGILAHIGEVVRCLVRAALALVSYLQLVHLFQVLVTAFLSSECMAWVQTAVLDLTWIVLEAFRRGAGAPGSSARPHDFAASRDDGRRDRQWAGRHGVSF